MLSLLSFRVYTSLVDQEEPGPYLDLCDQVVSRDLPSTLKGLRSLVCSIAVNFDVYNSMTAVQRSQYLRTTVSSFITLINKYFQIISFNRFEIMFWYHFPAIHFESSNRRKLKACITGCSEPMIMVPPAMSLGKPIVRQTSLSITCTLDSSEQFLKV